MDQKAVPGRRLQDLRKFRMIHIRADFKCYLAESQGPEKRISVSPYCQIRLLLVIKSLLLRLLELCSSDMMKSPDRRRTSDCLTLKRASAVDQIFLASHKIESDTLPGHSGWCPRSCTGR
jgi:hypothetical protein